MKKISKNIERKPDWLKIKLPSGENYLKVKEILKQNHLHTICSSGKCPNIAECWGCGTATFMILGNVCTRSCKFCATLTGKPEQIDHYEPEKIANSVKLLNLKHCVITSVDRDDLQDGGATLWANTINQVKKINPQTSIEVLIPDFDGKPELVDMIIKEKPEIISHNLETVKRLTPMVRSKAKYELSLRVIEHVSNSKIKSKSGIMVGLGETENEIKESMLDLLKAGCKILTIGQYLQPTINHWPVEKYITPEEFIGYKETGLKLGFEFVESGPLVRSSYHAEKHI